MSIIDSVFTNDAGFAANEVAAAVLAGTEAARKPEPIGEGPRFYTQLIGDKLEVIDVEALEADWEAKYGERDNPRRKTGTAHVQDAASFIRYLEKHQVAATEVYADLARQALVGVINAHGESLPEDDHLGDAGHGDHRVKLELIPTEEWKIWTGLTKKQITQQAFAEHLEDNAADVIRPDAATMLEVASSLVATTGVDFKSAVRLSSGEVQFRYEEDTTARAGHGGDLEIPQTFTIAVAPFVGSELVEVEARFRYRLSNGTLSLSYALLRPDQIARQAFLDHVEAVADAITPPVFQGRPE